MYTKNILVASSALIAAVAAIPLNKRDTVWVTQTVEVVVTVPVTTTVWVDWDASSSPAAVNAQQTGHYGHSTLTLTSHIQSTVYSPAYSAPAPVSSSPIAPVSTAESSVYVAPISTSVYVAPTTSSVYVALATPAASSTYVAPSSTYSAPAVTSVAASTGSGVTAGMGVSGTSYTGDMTWFVDGTGACGWTSGPADHIVAISHFIFDSYAAAEDGNPNKNPLCGKTVTITGVDGSPYQATIVDRCTGCAAGDLDLSPDYFKIVTTKGDGRVHGVSWKFD